MKKMLLSAGFLALFAHTAAYAQLLQPTTKGALGGVQNSINHPIPRPLPEIPVEPKAALDRIGANTGSLLQTLPEPLTIIARDGSPGLIEVTVGGEFRAVEREWLVDVSSADVAKLRAAGVDVLSERRYPALGMHTLRIRVPAALDSREALRQLLPGAQDNAWVRNHIYAPQGVSTSTTPEVQAPSGKTSVCGKKVRVGMIDTAVNDHTALANADITRRTFTSPGLRPASAHGTAVAGLLVGRGKAMSPLLPNGQLYAASVFYSRDEFSQGATLDSLLDALQWLAEQSVGTINMSLAGPPNRLLHRAIQSLADQQIFVVAAVGNEGPAAPPLYPAAYPESIAVTAVDHSKNIYRWAIQGDHVDFAALGVGVMTARHNNKEGIETGTSMAAPVVSAKVACALRRGVNLRQLKTDLRATAMDLGEPGRDPVFGDGLLQRN